MIFEYKYRVGIEDVDRDNVITSKAILKMFEDMACFHAASLGHDPISVVEMGFAWVLANWQIKILKRAYYGEILNVKTWPKKFEKITTLRDYEIIDENGEVVAIGTSRWFIIDIKTRRPMRISEEYARPYLPLTEEDAIEKMDKIEEPEKYEYRKEYVVCRRDIDSNKHMHNINYLDVALEIISEEIFENNKFDNISIEYKKELMYKDKVDCYYGQKDGKNIITMKTDDKVHAIISLS